MSQIKFKCPACHQTIEAPYAARAEGVVCPACQTGFVPADFQIVPSAPEPKRPAPALPEPEFKVAVSSATAESQRVRTHAENVSAVGKICLAIAAVLFLIAVFLAVAEDDWPAGVGSAAAGFVTLAIALQVVAQLLHIRALLEGRGQ